MDKGEIEQILIEVFLKFSLHIGIPLLLHTHLSLPPKMHENPD
jgi:hypothetical protein